MPGPHGSTFNYGKHNYSIVVIREDNQWLEINANDSSVNLASGEICADTVKIYSITTTG